MSDIKVLVQKIHALAKMPKYAHQWDSGVDLFSVENITIQPQCRALVHTGIKMAIPCGYEGQVRPKSGLALKHGISVVNTPGTVDAPYRGEICVILINTDAKTPYEIKVGDKIAQMVFAKVEAAELQEAEDLGSTERGEGGFGSTGK